MLTKKIVLMNNIEVTMSRILVDAVEVTLVETRCAKTKKRLKTCHFWDSGRMRIQDHLLKTISYE